MSAKDESATHVGLLDVLTKLGKKINKVYFCSDLTFLNQNSFKFLRFDCRFQLCKELCRNFNQAFKTNYDCMQMPFFPLI